jgi:hypothetical protein
MRIGIESSDFSCERIAIKTFVSHLLLANHTRRLTVDEEM